MSKILHNPSLAELKQMINEANDKIPETKAQERKRIKALPMPKGNGINVDGLMLSNLMEEVSSFRIFGNINYN